LQQKAFQIRCDIERNPQIYLSNTPSGVQASLPATYHLIPIKSFYNSPGGIYV